MSERIPDDVMNHAEAVYDKLGRNSTLDAETIALAILSAEKRGEERGLRRAAEIAKTCIIRVPLGVGMADGACKAADQIVAAILSQANEGTT